MMRLKHTIFLMTLLVSGNLFSEVGAIVSAGQIQDAVIIYLDDQFSASGMRYELEWVKEITDLDIGEPVDEISVSHRANSDLSGNRVLKVSFLYQSRLLRSMYVPVSIHVFGYVWVSGFALRRGEEVNISKIRLEEKDISELKGSPLIKSTDGTNLVVKKNIPANHVLLERDVRPAYLVHKGSALDVAVNQGNMKVSIQATALQNGGKNEVIWVKNPQNNKKIKVKIVGPKMAVLP